MKPPGCFLILGGIASLLLALLHLVLVFRPQAWRYFGAGVIRPLPLLQTVLIVISAIYILRGLALPFDLVKALRGKRSFRFAVFSTSSLVTGLLYLVGTLIR